MFTILIVILLTWLLTALGFTLTTEFNSSLKIIIISTIALTIIFWIIHFITSKDKEVEKYDKMWDEPEIIVSGMIYSVLTAAIMLKMLFNIESGKSFLEGTLLLWIILIVSDIINIVIVFHSYSYELKESIKDSIMLQIRRVRYGLLLCLVAVVALNFTIVGALLFACFFAIIWGFLFGKKK